MTENDLLSDTISYSLQDTGQGMKHVQPSPRIYQAMQRILSRVQSKVSHWVGSSVIHMGDHNVPNALSFIDKYTQGTHYLSSCAGFSFDFLPPQSNPSSSHPWANRELPVEPGTHLRPR
jgi:Protein of unknown function (DUF2009)